MTTWTPIGGASNTWTAENFPTTVFSRLVLNQKFVFSHATFGGKKIFAVGSSEGLWDYETALSTTWTPE